MALNAISSPEGWSSEVDESLEPVSKDEAPSLAQRPITRQRVSDQKILVANRQGLDRDRNAVEPRERKAAEGFVVRETLVP